MNQDLVEAWIDSGEVSRLADSLQDTREEPVKQKKALKEDLGFIIDDSDLNPVRTAASGMGARMLTERDLAERLSTNRVKPESGNVSPLRKRYARTVSVREQSTSTTRNKRSALPKITPRFAVRKFILWLKDKVEVNSAFICDERGELIYDETNNEDLVQIACTLARASRTRLHNEAGSTRAGGDGLRATIGGEEALEIFPVNSSSGLLILGLMVEQSLPNSISSEILYGFEEAVGEELYYRSAS